MSTVDGVVDVARKGHEASAERDLSATRLGQRVLAEFIGTALLLIAVIGSGIMAQNLSPGDTGLELLENAAATGAALVAIILAVGSVSGAHLNPVVSAADAFFGGLRRVELAAYIVAQVAGAIVGVIIANVMFALPVVSISTKVRTSPNLWFSEVIATFGLLLVIFGLTRTGRGAAAPFAVGAYILGAYFFTSSTSFANPAVTIARTLSDTFAGIAPSSVIPFVIAQFIGAALAIVTIRVLWPGMDDVSHEVVVPHESDVSAREVKGV
jgi:arsenate reductase